MDDLRFKNWFEATDIFGFEDKATEENIDDGLLARPIHRFNLQEMMDFLSYKKIGQQTSKSPFINEIQWGSEPGASVKLEVDTGFTFYLKKLVTDLAGEQRWITKKMFQLNRSGYGGHEDSVAGEIHEHLENTYSEPMDSANPDYHDLESLVLHITNKIRRTAKEILMYDGVKKLDENNYLIIFSVRGQGVEAPGHRRVEENLTQITYDKDSGTIRVQNYNVESPTGGAHEWALQPKDMDVFFLPSQSREEISEAVCVFFKYY